MKILEHKHWLAIYIFVTFHTEINERNLVSIWLFIFLFKYMPIKYIKFLTKSKFRNRKIGRKKIIINTHVLGIFKLKCKLELIFTY
jgi:hypothetical protein